MSPPVLPILAAALALLACVPAARAHDDEPWAVEAARRDKKATVLFATIVKDLPAPPKTCEIDAVWSTYGIDYQTAHEAIGLEVHADLANPWPIADLSALLGAAVAKDAVCDEAARGRDEAARIAAWQTALKALAKGAKPPPAPSFVKRSFSYPLFDRDYRRAVLMRQVEGFTARFDAHGERLPTSRSGGGSALVYARDAGGWHKLAEIEVYTVD